MFFALDYNTLREKHCLNTTQADFHNANHASEKQQDFASKLDNLAIADFPEKDIISQIITSNKKLAYSNKILTVTITSLVQNGTGKRGHSTQTFKAKPENQKHGGRNTF